ncbi:MAG: undecaprenyl/decaprenyl-phosphate alpha-N-acetylglucosaminyl 1-phosphate transferase [Bacteroidetes bacterium]|nr:MAG: undecaprenyl/decaprenyl-phosphate alpha-N-acetylglucosaminyl 1-phosphate transferase [Bacteroidota bacterium]MBL1143333.1 undecaprenyl/decaprenyl-phosphate alpha-N-acetylglucosaminyl 1-phosphate transferase [Bacteroidota bacterium]MCB0801626.1 undecaprenyl/decaprenyl-phosphate alpha-N-acetylglucosaminyl 1-phosphate transferase [Flavobacteriales bacterium]NOG56135.1 undecaprenyl/decaprenyl-phosphate alpha-N-acetylglucosaminyl 1-phosphate transferase [Bacteroidota bacterium]
MAIAAAIMISFFIVLFATPSFIKVAELKNLFDEPGDQRKLHKTRIPSMGGIMIFAGTLFSFFICFPSEDIGYIKFLVPSILVLFFIGIKDDIIGTAPVKKLLGHLLVAFIMVLMAEVKITSLYGIFEVRELPDWASISLSIFTYVVIINAFNLIDGVDGLAAGVGCIAATSFGIWFLLLGSMVDAIIAFSLAGSLLGFLRFNFHPANIFMGDSGSLTVGLIICVLAIRVIEFRPDVMPVEMKFISKPIFAMAVLSYPLLDTLRIFVYRMLKGTSPFTADKNHIHHRLIFLGLSHAQTVGVIYLFNVSLIAYSILVKGLNTSYTFIILAAIVFIAMGGLFLIPVKQKKQT